MRWFPWFRRRTETPLSAVSRDQRLAQLSAKAALIVDELDDVVQQLRRKTDES